MPTATVPSVAAGDLHTAALWNTYLRDNLNHLLKPPRVYALRTTNQTGIVPSTPTAIQFNGVDAWDTDTMHDPATNNTRITFTTAGAYSIKAAVVIQALDAGRCDLNIRKNGSTILKTTRWGIINSTTDLYMEIALDQQFNAGDYIEIVVNHTATVNRDLPADGSGNYPHVTAHWIGTL